MKLVKLIGKALCRKGKLLFSAFLLIPVVLLSQVNINPGTIEAYNDVLSLDFLRASTLIAKDKKNNPSGIFSIYLENYIDFLSAFISEELVSVARFEENFSPRINHIESVKINSSYRDYFLGNMYLQDAILKIRRGNYFSAATSLSSSWEFFKKNEKAFPGFLPAKTGSGILLIMAASIPDNYKGFLAFTGFEGDLDEGVRKLRMVIDYNGDDEFGLSCRVEAMLYLAIVEGALSADKMKAVNIIRSFDRENHDSEIKSNPLVVYVKAKIFMNAGLNDIALETLLTYKAKPGIFPFYYLDYLTGKAKMNKLVNDADYYLRRFVTYYKGETYIKSAYQYLSWHAFITGQNKKYEQYRKMVAIYGAAISETDKQAIKESATKILSVPLLKARLLFDGGYYNNALDLLINTSLEISVRSKKDLLEYNYRLGRIYQEIGDSDKAIKYFGTTISSGTKEPWYFASNAAFQSGLIMEKRGNYTEAMTYYKLCISMDSDEYKTSLDQKAKAGIKRVKKYLP